MIRLKVKAWWASEYVTRDYLVRPESIAAVEFRGAVTYGDGSQMSAACAVVFLAGVIDGQAGSPDQLKLHVEDVASIDRLQALEVT